MPAGQETDDKKPSNIEDATPTLEKLCKDLISKQNTIEQKKVHTKN